MKRLLVIFIRGGTVVFLSHSRESLGIGSNCVTVKSAILLLLSNFGNMTAYFLYLNQSHGEAAPPDYINVYV